MEVTTRMPSKYVDEDYATGPEIHLELTRLRIIQSGDMSVFGALHSQWCIGNINE